MPEVDADPAIPTLREVVGHGWGEDVSDHAQISRYLRALADAAPDRTELVRYGETYEGRALHYLVITSADLNKRLDAIRSDRRRLADPRSIEAIEAADLIASTPPVVWLAYGVHGDESSSSDAALVTAYTLLADRREETVGLLEDVIVVIDPLQNPDGRDRFVGSYRRARGVFPQGEPEATDHQQPWPGGRSNHYLFDMNRDWYIQSQAESKARVAAYLEWQPQVYVDAHEMGRGSSYYFDPATDPYNPEITERQNAWVERIARRQAGRFDELGFAYTTREIFDAFYPGYGSTWPMFQGGVGILWEQAGVRGLVVDREDRLALHYRDAVRHHYISGLATIAEAASDPSSLLRDFFDGRLEAVERGRSGAVPDTILLPGSNPGRAARLSALLRDNGIEVRRLTAPLAFDPVGDTEPMEAPAGSYFIPASQPAGRLAETLLASDQEMGAAFIERQLDRKGRRLGDEIYDVTAWSLPMTYGVEALRGRPDVEPESEPFGDGPATPEGHVDGPERPKVGYLVPAEDESALDALSGWLRDGLRVHVVDRPFTLGGRSFDRGTLLLRAAENPEGLHEAVRTATQVHGLEVVATDTAFVDEGAGLGGPNVAWVMPPEVLLAFEEPVATGAGHTWYLFDQVWDYPTTRVAARSIAGRFDLDPYNVLVLPDGGYGPSDGFDAEAAAKLRRWVSAGGTLILVDGALRWAIGEEIALVPTEPRKVPVGPIPGEGLDEPIFEADPDDDDDGEEAPTESPRPVPGAFLRATVYDDHWVTAGLPGSIDVLTRAGLIVEPLDATEGRNLVTFEAQETPVAGFCWPDTLEAIGRSPLVLYRSIGRGHIIGFTDDPNARAMSPVTQRLFRNAAFFGPGH